VNAREEVAKQINEAGLVIKESKTKQIKIKRNIINLEKDLIMNGELFQRAPKFRF
jgi:hypothetical protein